ncbi:MAG TPA: DUF6454 family protein [Kineosporiaceae bacterium]|nr:DUF6454 family protein [Kineosporiaceae bacterium]
MGRRSRGFVVGAASAVLAVSVGTVVPTLTRSAGSIASVDAVHVRTPGRGSPLGSDLAVVDRSTAWTQLSKLKLDFPTYHPEGLAVTRERFYLSSTQIIEPPQKYPTPVDGFDRTPGKGVGHLFVIDRAGKLLKDIILGQDIVYHPGGIDLHGHDLWVPVAQYRPDSSAEIDHIDTRTLKVTRRFTVNDHIGGIIYDASRGRLVGNSWGSRTFYEWTLGGRQIRTWRNPENLIDFQDCQYVPTAKMACAGVTNLPQTPTAGGAAAVYELGGITLIDLRTRAIINEFPFQQWSDAGHVMTRNPVKLTASGKVLTMWAAPDNGEEVAGTQIYTWQATVNR